MNFMDPVFFDDVFSIVDHRGAKTLFVRPCLIVYWLGQTSTSHA